MHHQAENRDIVEVVANFADLYNAVVVDVWLANTDRNAGNCVAFRGPDDRIRLVMIDFEKSATLRGLHPIMQSNQVSDNELWPTGELGALMKAVRPASPLVRVRH